MRTAGSLAAKAIGRRKTPVRRRAMAELTRGSARWKRANDKGAIAQLGERVLCKHEVVGSIPSGSTRTRDG